jgi:hypothetical protein
MAEWMVRRSIFKGRTFKRKIRLGKPFLAAMALIAPALLAAPPSALAQSCALCYTQAASAGNRMIQALQSGILILIIPPTLMSVVMIFVVCHKRNQFRQDDAPRSDRSW